MVQGDSHDALDATNDDAVVQRHENARERESAPQSRTVKKILEAAQERDLDAEARDRVSTDRDHDADLTAFTAPGGATGYGADLPARRHAAMDRRDAKSDRTSAAQGRVALTRRGTDLDTDFNTEEDPPEGKEEPPAGGRPWGQPLR